MIFRKIEGEALVFCDFFNIIISHILSESFIEISQVVQKLWRISLPILAIFINYHQFSGLGWVKLKPPRKKLPSIVCGNFLVCKSEFTCKVKKTTKTTGVG